MSKSIRNDSIDLLKGYSILLVIIFHLTYYYSGQNWIRVFVGPFFMPLFFFASGIFYSSKSSFKEFFLNKVNRLIIPLFFFYFLNYFLGFLYSTFLSKDNDSVDNFSWSDLLDLFNGQEYFTYAGALWFLVCIFFV